MASKLTRINKLDLRRKPASPGINIVWDWPKVPEVAFDTYDDYSVTFEIKVSNFPIPLSPRDFG